MDKFSRGFYNSTAWKNTREAYKKSKGGLCEDCLRNGIINPGAEVHHIVKLSPENIHDPDITLNWDNLCLLCSNCHAARHTRRRYKVDEWGRVTT